MKTCLKLSFLVPVGVCGLALRFPATLAVGEETPVSSATPAAAAAHVSSTQKEVYSETPAAKAGVGISPTPLPTVPPSVRAVGVHNWKGIEQRHVYETYARRGDTIWVDIINFDDWVNSLEKKPANHDIQDLILYIDHFPMLGVSRVYSYKWDPQWTAKGTDGSPPIKYTVTTVGFPLVRTDSSKPGWSHVLNQPVLNRRVIVSAGFSSGEEIPSEVTFDKVTGEDQQFYLTIIPAIRTGFGFIVILGALIVFFWLARYTDIVRDATAPRRPDGQRPYSLARGQMAFWFFLVIAAYFFLWIVTGDMNTLNSSVLALIGISAGTALGSAFVDAAKPVPVASSGNQPIVDVTRPHNEVLADLKKLQADTEQELEALQKARTLLSSSDKEALDNNERQQNEVRERLGTYRWQSAYFAWPTWKGVMYDLLAENNLISFHRFQIFIWTLILGIMFVTSVYNELAMPEFSATLLGLLGISAGTYVGFKLPETKTA